ncbi:type II toxin-antitoxin system VapB family antitoxin [Actinoallomurus purpureus]|uniref:type II toxin-antitoxin system VapB family antitoxin n=1 Tax=Actinoallomurus purpureus TaxID=478114 RepID=UPI002092FF00|nr:type II toxin-antitoxin system VapB family antitoxin [Actinoallomurus purpureus]MCO6007680.1 type II toxin-antitoxin system VapB family antitoxin [Actinoallomurus purpureus]
MRIDDQLLADAKAFAAQHHRSLNSVIEDALRQLLQRARTPEPEPVDFPVYGGSGPASPDIDLNDPRVLKALMYEDEEEYYRMRAHDAAG